MKDFDEQPQNPAIISTIKKWTKSTTPSNYQHNQEVDQCQETEDSVSGLHETEEKDVIMKVTVLSHPPTSFLLKTEISEQNTIYIGLEVNGVTIAVKTSMEALALGCFMNIVNPALTIKLEEVECPIRDDPNNYVMNCMQWNLWKVFKKYKDQQDHVPIQKLRLACNELGLLPSKCQVYEMVQCAVEYGSPCEPDHITFGEFCVLISELQSYYSLSPASPKPRSLFKERIETFGGKRKRRVFLGGSCNPTTWRADKAIPFFKDHGITFYNPVQSWIPELMELEAQAKQMADVLFFVIDTETRAVASMIETAYLIACKRQVVMVIPEYQKPSVMISEEKISDSELSDLERGRLILTDLAERNSVPAFTSLDPALEGTKIILAKGIRVQDLTLKDGAQPVRYGFLKLGEALLQLREAFNSVDSTKRDKLSAKDICLAYKCCTGEDLDTDWLKRKQKPVNDYLFEDFCCIVTENRENVHPDTLIERLVSNLMSSPLRWILRKISSRPPPPCLREVDNIEDVRDIYLGGSCGGSRWREDIAEPQLRKQGLSYINPCGNGWSRKLIPILVASREKCRMFLYVITNETRSLTSMIEAGYYIGMGCKLVLCVQKLQKDYLLGGEQMTENGIKDYNRGRDYLCDLANREGVPLFEDVMEAVNCVITSLTHGHTSAYQEPLHF